jgi:hypothetical protein
MLVAAQAADRPVEPEYVWGPPSPLTGMLRALSILVLVFGLGFWLAWVGLTLAGNHG